MALRALSICTGGTAGLELWIMTKEQNRIRIAAWRARNRARDREINNASYRRHAAKRCAEKRVYYQVVRKLRDRTVLGRLKETLKKENRRASGSITADQWNVICFLFGSRCAYCGQLRHLTMDHVIPVSKGGSSDFGNIVPACQPCNSSKGAGMFPGCR